MQAQRHPKSWRTRNQLLLQHGHQNQKRAANAEVLQRGAQPQEFLQHAVVEMAARDDLRDERMREG